jgi:hypothetical protein
VTLDFDEKSGFDKWANGCPETYQRPGYAAGLSDMHLAIVVPIISSFSKLLNANNLHDLAIDHDSSIWLRGTPVRPLRALCPPEYLPLLHDKLR